MKELIERIRQIDNKAAEYLESPEGIEKSNAGAQDLDSLMEWAFTPQGHFYWSEIHRKLIQGGDAIKKM
jgi:hypothetical protein